MALIEATPVLKFLGVIDGTPELQRKRPLDLQTQKLADRYTDIKKFRVLRAILLPM